MIALVKKAFASLLRAGSLFVGIRNFDQWPNGSGAKLGTQIDRRAGSIGFSCPALRHSQGPRRQAAGAATRASGSGAQRLGRWPPWEPQGPPARCASLPFSLLVGVVVCEKIDQRKVGTLILASLLEDLDKLKNGEVPGAILAALRATDFSKHVYTPNPHRSLKNDLARKILVAGHGTGLQRKFGRNFRVTDTDSKVSLRKEFNGGLYLLMDEIHADMHHLGLTPHKKGTNQLPTGAGLCPLQYYCGCSRPAKV